MSPVLRVASFNVNGIRARLPLLLNWLKHQRLEVVCLQETKVQDGEFPQAALGRLGYRSLFRGEKGFNGVAVLSREPQELLGVGLDDGGPPDESRLILVRLLGLPILNTYVPQGTAPDSDRFQYKLDWLLRVRRFLERHFMPNEPLVWVGDFNVAPEPRRLSPSGDRGWPLYLLGLSNQKCPGQGNGMAGGSHLGHRTDGPEVPTGLDRCGTQRI